MRSLLWINNIALLFISLEHQQTRVCAFQVSSFDAWSQQRCPVCSELKPPPSAHSVTVHRHWQWYCSFVACSGTIRFHFRNWILVFILTLFSAAVGRCFIPLHKAVIKTIKALLIEWAKIHFNNKFIWTLYWIHIHTGSDNNCSNRITEVQKL